MVESAHVCYPSKIYQFTISRGMQFLSLGRSLNVVGFFVSVFFLSSFHQPVEQVCFPSKLMQALGFEACYSEIYQPYQEPNAIYGTIYRIDNMTEASWFN